MSKDNHRKTFVKTASEDIGKRYLFSERHGSKSYNKTTKKICFYVYRELLPFFAPVIQHIPTGKIDILFGSKRDHDRQMIDDMGLSAYDLVYYAPNIKNYDVVVSDHYLGEWLFHGQIGIGLYHSMEGIVSDKELEKLSAFIYPTLVQAAYQNLAVSPVTHKFMNSVPRDAICEMAYSGPYHAESFLDADKNTLRDGLSSRFNVDLNNGKLIIYFPDDHASMEGQIIHCINQLSEYCTVFYKRMHNTNTRSIRRLSAHVIVIQSETYAPNELRFAADFTFAGLYSGTLYSSLMLGLPVIPYYSRYGCYNYSHQHYGRPGRTFYYVPTKRIAAYDADFNLATPRARVSSWLRQNSLLFDLLDDKGIQSALLTPEYKQCFQAKLKLQRKFLFGDYICGGAAKVTAQYIMDFATNGTFGKNCAAIHLRRAAGNKAI